jgi:hypothetical protein
MANIYNLSDTWNAGATVFTAIKMNVTDTASAAASLLMDLQVGGVSRFSVTKAGTIQVPGLSDQSIISAGTAAIRWKTGNRLAFSTADNASFITIEAAAIWLAGANRLTSISSGVVRFTNYADTAYAQVQADSLSLQTDTILARDAANTLAQRNGVNAQAFNLYNTYTDASNYERGFMRFVSNVLQIGAEKLGTGTARALEFYTGGTQALSISTAGLLSVAASGNHQFHAGTNSTAILVSSRSAFGYSGLTYLASGANKDIEFRAGASVPGFASDTVVRLTPAGSMEIAKGLTVATLPTPVVGMMARVTDATTPVVGMTVAGGGAAAALCWYNGTNWTVIGV